MSDPLVQPLEHTAEKAGKALGEDMAHALGGVYEETAQNVHTVAQNVEENEKKLVRKYFIDDEGNVKEIVDGKLQSIKADDASGIKGILEDGRQPDGVKTLTDEERKELSAKKSDWKKKGRAEEDWKESEKLTEPTELSKAVEEARRAQKDGAGDYGGTNYAALHYASEDGKQEFILVGRSSGERSHSERSIGYPMVHNGKQFRVDELYTERRPCQKGSTCDRWLNMHMYDPAKNPDLRITHGVQYDSSIKDPVVRNEPFGRYISQLQADHAASPPHYGGTAGSQDFDTAPPTP
ncbi:nucleic acid/nucleotide deaminase domain-containing protein [Streptacidiphilus anmyonensis]|uniref:nucleic acid/nucleotide deaminase domain-containing protein n=1 Tax=Streptacidiphilus anmyonensis TaxID=405782 RepID=UPI0005AB3F26|nr:nucleic acid/nucleotide deaminase domain-containing protein [Streptacidiphilus anmyonensis]